MRHFMNPVSSINETDLLIMENLCHVMSNRSENIIIIIHRDEICKYTDEFALERYADRSVICNTLLIYSLV